MKKTTPMGQKLLEITKLATSEAVDVPLLLQRVAEAVLLEREACAVIAQNFKGGYTANIRTGKDEQEFSRDKDGPWVLNSDVAAAIRVRRR